MLDQLVDATILYPLVMILFVGSAFLGFRLGVRVRGKEKSEDMTTLTASALGLLALLLAFSLSQALSRYETRRALILDEANAIHSTAHFASMLPAQAQDPILNLLREYVTLHITIGRPYDRAKLDRDVAKSNELMAKLWQCAVEVSEPQSLPANRFINSLNDINKIQERRLASARYYLPSAILFVLIALGVVAIGFTGYQSGLTQSHLRAATLIMAILLAVMIVLVVDLDQPVRGLIQVLSGLNEMNDAATLRTLGIISHLPFLVVLLLLFTVLLASFLTGHSMAVSGARDWLSAVIFAIVVSSAIYVILDYEYPRGGLIRVDPVDQLLVQTQEKME